MKRIACLCAGVLLWGLPALASETPDPSGAVPFAWRAEANTAFSAGEKIRYVIKYGVLPAGFATLDIAATETIQGRKAYRIFSEAKTNKGLDVVYKVRDKNESWMDVESLCSLMFRQDMREGGYRRRVESVFDHVGRRFTYRKWRKGTESLHEGAAPAFVQDVLSSLYYIRTRPLVVGQSYTLDANSGKKNWPLIVHVRGRERVKVPAGTYACLKIEPVMAGEGIFQAKGKLEVWVTDDEHRVPVLLRSKVAVGAFDAEMTDYRPGKSEN